MPGGSEHFWEADIAILRERLHILNFLNQLLLLFPAEVFFIRLGPEADHFLKLEPCEVVLLLRDLQILLHIEYALQALFLIEFFDSFVGVDHLLRILLLEHEVRLQRSAVTEGGLLGLASDVRNDFRLFQVAVQLLHFFNEVLAGALASVVQRGQVYRIELTV